MSRRRRGGSLLPLWQAPSSRRTARRVARRPSQSLGTGTTTSVISSTCHRLGPRPRPPPAPLGPSAAPARPAAPRGQAWGAGPQGRERRSGLRALRRWQGRVPALRFRPVGQGGEGPECLLASHRRKLPAGAGQTPARCGERLAGEARWLRRAAQRLRRWLGLAHHHPPAAVNARSRSRNSSGSSRRLWSERSRARRLGATTGRASSARGEASFRSPLGMLSARTRRPSVLGQARAGKTCRPNASMNGPCSWPTWWRFTSSKPSAAASSIQATC